MRRNRIRPPDLTSLFDVLFILVFVSLVNAGVNKQAADAAVEAAKPKPPPPAPPGPPPTVVALQKEALASLGERPVLVARVSKDGVLRALEADGRTVALDVPLTAPDPQLELVYLGDRSSELHVCRQAALHLGVADLAKYLVILAPDAPVADLTVGLVDGLRRDVERCLVEQHGVAVLVGNAGSTP